MTNTINVLGMQYNIQLATSETDERLKDYDGYCDYHSKLIVIDCAEDGDIHDYEAYRRSVARHEIVHAFLYESGLCNNACHYSSAWATNEELVDWIAIQGQKLHKAWEEAGCLD